MMGWIDSLADWDGALPSTLVVVGASAAERRALLPSLAAKALGRAPDAVRIEHPGDHAPAVVVPAGSGLHLSSASRADVSALAIASTPVGVDVEFVEGEAEIPWRVLHRSESAFLQRLRAEDRAPAFARLWSLKEAYLKALGIGLAREPASFAVEFLDQDAAAFADPLKPAEIAEARTIWRGLGLRPAAISIVLLAASRPRA